MISSEVEKNQLEYYRYRWSIEHSFRFFQKQWNACKSYSYIVYAKIFQLMDDYHDYSESILADGKNFRFDMADKMKITWQTSDKYIQI